MADPSTATAPIGGSAAPAPVPVAAGAPLFGAFTIATAVHVSVGNDDLDLAAGRYEPASLDEFAALSTIAENTPRLVRLLVSPPAGIPEGAAVGEVGG